MLDGYQQPSYDKAIEMFKWLHLKMPFFNIIGWDIAIQEDGDSVLIEFNSNPGLSQSAFKSGMRKYTERVIRELFPRPNGPRNRERLFVIALHIRNCFIESI